jgi:hypothetical protein
MTRLAAGALLLCAAATWCAEAPAPAVPVDLDQVPEAVRRQIASQGTLVDHIEQQTSPAGTVIYAVYVPRGGGIVRVLIDADGRLLGAAALEPLRGAVGGAAGK